MYGPAARRKPEIEGGERGKLHQCIRPRQWSDCAPGHNGNPRASRAHKLPGFRRAKSLLSLVGAPGRPFVHLDDCLADLGGKWLILLLLVVFLRL